MPTLYLDTIGVIIIVVRCVAAFSTFIVASLVNPHPLPDPILDEPQDWIELVNAITIIILIE